jgi:hypothetical protein
VDSATRQPIPQVNIWTKYSHTISDADGNFSLIVYKGDTVHFTHISYYDFKIKLDHDIHSFDIISLYQKIRLLDEVKVHSYISESAFKKKIMETIPVLSREEEIAKTNSKIMTYLARYAPAAPMNANENYIEYMKGPQGVVIFSNNPSKGLIKAIKNVFHHKPTFEKFYRSDSLLRLR